MELGNVSEYSLYVNQNAGSAGSSTLYFDIIKLYTSGSTPTPTPTAAPTPTPTPTATPTPTPTPTATPTPTPTPTPGGNTTYGFDDYSADWAAIEWTHGGIVWPNSGWQFHVTGGGMSKCAAIGGSGMYTKTFTLPSGTHLKSIRISGTAGGTYTISDGVNANVSGNVINNTPTLVSTGWTQNAATITINLSAGWNSYIDDITYGP
jgi:hypothetical protein